MSRSSPEVRRATETARGVRRMAEAKELLGGACVVCGETEKLQFDHVDPKTKLFNISNGAVRYSEERFWTEVQKCQLLCRPHHDEKSKSEGSLSKPQKNPKTKLRDLDVLYIRGLYGLGHSKAAIAREFNVSRVAVFHVLAGTAWKHV